MNIADQNYILNILCSKYYVFALLYKKKTNQYKALILILIIGVKIKFKGINENMVRGE